MKADYMCINSPDGNTVQWMLAFTPVSDVKSLAGKSFAISGVNCLPLHCEFKFRRTESAKLTFNADKWACYINVGVAFRPYSNVEAAQLQGILISMEMTLFELVGNILSAACTLARAVRGNTELMAAYKELGSPEEIVAWKSHYETCEFGRQYFEAEENVKKKRKVQASQEHSFGTPVDQQTPRVDGDK